MGGGQFGELLPWLSWHSESAEPWHRAMLEPAPWHRGASHIGVSPPVPYLIKFFIELAELRHLLHDLFPHEEGGVNGSVASTSQSAECVLDERLLQEHQDPLRSRHSTWGWLLSPAHSADTLLQRQHSGTNGQNQDSPMAQAGKLRPQTATAARRYLFSRGLLFSWSIKDSYLETLTTLTSRTGLPLTSRRHLGKMVDTDFCCSPEEQFNGLPSFPGSFHALPAWPPYCYGNWYVLLFGISMMSTSPAQFHSYNHR